MGGAHLEQQKLGVWSLTFIGLSAMLGSGWLLASYYVYEQAGNYAPLSWVLGFIMILIIALSFAETCSIISKDGATILLPRISHGYMTSLIFGFFGLISWVALIPIEVTATLQYLTYFISGLYSPSGHFTHFGLGVAIGLVLAISMINTFSMLWIKRLNNMFFTPLKIGIPLIVIGYSLLHAYTTHPHLVHTASHLSGVFAALPVGVVFSFNAFKTVCVIAGRAHSSKKTIMKSLILSLVICLFLYLGLQLALNLNATKLVIESHQSPYALILRDSSFMLILLYIGAISSPFSANIFNLHAANACCYRMSALQYLPKIFSKLNKYQQYIFANIFNSIIAILFVFKSGSWDTMVQNLTCIMIITYAAAPIALISFRKNLHSIKRGVHLPAAGLISFLGFLFSTYMVYWTGYNAIELSFILLIIVSIFGLVYWHFISGINIQSLYRSTWLFIWLGLILLLSRYSTMIKSHPLSLQESLLYLTIISAGCYVLSIKLSLPEKTALKIYNEVK